jgi:hypothetical protein
MALAARVNGFAFSFVAIFTPQNGPLREQIKHQTPVLRTGYPWRLLRSPNTKKPNLCSTGTPLSGSPLNFDVRP